MAVHAIALEIHKRHRSVFVSFLYGIPGDEDDANDTALLALRASLFLCEAFDGVGTEEAAR